MTATDAHRTIDAVWRIESPKIIAAIARMVRDVGEDLAHDALIAALEQWPSSGTPDNAAAWLMAAAKHRAIDHFRRSKMLDRKHEELGRDLDDPILSAEARGADRDARLSSVLEVIYLLFNEGYSATAGDDWMRPELCHDALRLGRILAELVPQEAEVHGLVALMEIQASRAAARVGKSGEPVLLLDQDRSRWDQLLIRRGLAALARARVSWETDWPRMAALGPAAGLAIIEPLMAEPSLTNYHLLPSVRGDLLAKLGRRAEARAEFERAASLTKNTREKQLLLARAADN